MTSLEEVPSHSGRQSGKSVSMNQSSVDAVPNNLDRPVGRRPTRMRPMERGAQKYWRWLAAALPAPELWQHFVEGGVAQLMHEHLDRRDDGTAAPSLTPQFEVAVGPVGEAGTCQRL